MNDSFKRRSNVWHPYIPRVAHSGLQEGEQILESKVHCEHMKFISDDEKYRHTYKRYGSTTLASFTYVYGQECPSEISVRLFTYIYKLVFDFRSPFLVNGLPHLMGYLSHVR